MVDSAKHVSSLTADIRRRLSTSFQLDCKFEIEPGFTVLFGPSGAGKTSVLDCIAGIKVPDSGRISLAGFALFDSRGKIDLSPQHRRLAYVFQSLALFPHLSVAENISYGIKGKRKSEQEQRCQNALQQFGIDHLSLRLPGDLSGGERQRVALARSLVTDPRALLLDEPLAALDRGTRMKIVDDLRAWNERHRLPILYVTHSVREALALGEQALLMQNGRIVASGSPSDLLDPQDWE